MMTGNMIYYPFPSKESDLCYVVTSRFVATILHNFVQGSSTNFIRDISRYIASIYLFSSLFA